MGKCSFVRDVECVEGLFQWMIVCGFVVVHIDDVGGLCLSAVKCVVLVELVLNDGCKICSDSSV